jgi:hypothetical protein
LLDLWFEAHHTSQSQPTEADVDYEWLLVHVDAEQHMSARSDGAFGHIPQHAGCEARHTKPKGIEHALQEQILFKTISATTLANDFLLE